MNILENICGNYVGNTFANLGSLYLNIEKIKGGIYDQMYKFIIYETKFTIPITKKHTMIFSSIDIINCISDNSSIMHLIVPTKEEEMDFINIIYLKIELNENNKIETFHIIFNDNNFWNVNMKGTNIKDLRT